MLTTGCDQTRRSGLHVVLFSSFQSAEESGASGINGRIGVRPTPRAACIPLAPVPLHSNENSK